jgi:hypothetical protein
MRVLANWWAALHRRGTKPRGGYGDEVLFAEWVPIPIPVPEPARAPQARKRPAAR